MSLFGCYNPIEDAMPEEIGEKVETVDLKTIFELDPNDEEYIEWMQAFKREFDAYNDTETYQGFTEQQARSMGVKPKDILPMKAVATRKPKPGKKRKIKKIRACLCGNFADTLVDENFSSYVPDWGHTRACINVASCRSWSAGLLDINNAVLHAPLPEFVWGRPPHAFVRAGLVEPGTLWRFSRAAYGLRQAPKLWAEELSRRLLEMEITVPNMSGHLKFLPLDGASQIFALKGDGDELVGILVAYVDDLLCLSTLEVVQATLAKIASTWPCKQQGFIGPDAPGSIQFLGIRLTCDHDGTYWLDQQKWFQAVLEDWGWTHLKPVKNLPDIPQGQLDPEVKDEKYEKNIKTAQSLVGLLQWMALRTRPDISALAGILGSASTIAPAAVTSWAKTAMRYLNGTQGLRLRCATPGDHNIGVLTCFGDASFSPGGGRSRSGWGLVWCGGVLDYGSTRQGLIALSSCEAEVKAAVDTWKRATELQNFFGMIGIYIPKLTLLTDNSAAVSSAPASWRNRHFSMFTQRLREEVALGHLEWKWIASSKMLADGLTKILRGDALTHFRVTVGLV